MHDLVLKISMIFKGSLSNEKSSIEKKHENETPSKTSEPKEPLVHRVFSPINKEVINSNTELIPV